MKEDLLMVACYILGLIQGGWFMWWFARRNIATERVTIETYKRIDGQVMARRLSNENWGVSICRGFLPYPRYGKLTISWWPSQTLFDYWESLEIDP